MFCCCCIHLCWHAGDRGLCTSYTCDSRVIHGHLHVTHVTCLVNDIDESCLSVVEFILGPITNIYIYIHLTLSCGILGGRVWTPPPPNPPFVRASLRYKEAGVHDELLFNCA